MSRSEKAMEVLAWVCRILWMGVKIGAKFVWKMVRAPFQSIDERAGVMSDAKREYEEIMGRRDAPDQVPDHQLEGVEPDMERVVEGMGARKGADGIWRVPEGQDLAPFKLWWPKVPMDLRNSKASKQLTKSGRLIESYVLIEDQAKGQDSTATVLMFAALPVIAALTYLATYINAWGALVVLSAVPYLWAIKQGEGIVEALKSGGLLLVAPLVLLNVDVGFVSVMGGSTIVFVVACIGVVIAFAAKWADKGIAMAFEKLIAMVKFLVLLFVLLAVSEFLGNVWVTEMNLAPAKMVWIFAMASLYPLYYVNQNFVDRAVRLDAQSKQFNLGTQGALSRSHIEAKELQAVSAVKDKSPLITIGTAFGYTAGKQYQYAPLANTVMCLSLRDMSMHTITFGKTGGGKTTNVMRPLAFQIRKSLGAGALVLDGKGALVSEIRSCMDLVIEPGLHFGLIEGMSSIDVATGFKQAHQAGRGKDKTVWDIGGDQVTEHILTLLEALHQHEKTYRSYASAMVSQADRDLIWLELEARIQRKLGQSDHHLDVQLDYCRQRLNAWKAQAIAPRRWAWTVSMISKVARLVECPVKKNGAWVFSNELREAMFLLGFCADPSEQELMQLEDRRKNTPQSIHPGIGKSGPLDQSLNYLSTSWLALEPEQRASFFININNMLQPLLRGAKLVDEAGVPWHMIEAGADVTRCLRGEFVGVDLPEVEHGEAGRIVASLVKQRIYAEIKKRAGPGEAVWRAQGQLPMMLMIDEAQRLIGDEERKFLPEARGLGMFGVFATQSYEGLLATYDSPAATDQLCGSFQNIIGLDASVATLEYISRRMGQAEMVSYKKQTIGLDYFGGVNNLVHAAISDVNHPNRAAMRRVERLGGCEFEMAVPALRGDNMRDWQELRDIRGIEDAAKSARIKLPVGGTKEMLPVLSTEELTSLLKAQGTAVVVLNRAGAPRIDIAKLNPITEAQARAMPLIARNNPPTATEEAA